MNVGLRKVQSNPLEKVQMKKNCWIPKSLKSFPHKQSSQQNRRVEGNEVKYVLWGRTIGHIIGYSAISNYIMKCNQWGLRGFSVSTWWKKNASVGFRFFLSTLTTGAGRGKKKSLMVFILNKIYPWLTNNTFTAPEFKYYHPFKSVRYIQYIGTVGFSHLHQVPDLGQQNL